MSEKEVKEQLLVLRDLFRMTGALHDAQHVQLRYLPRVCIAHSTYSEVAIQFTPEDPKAPRVVTVKVEVKGKEPKNLKVGLAKLNEWIKFLLGEDFEVVIKYAHKVLRWPGDSSWAPNRTHQPRQVAGSPDRAAGAKKAHPARAKDV